MADAITLTSTPKEVATKKTPAVKKAEPTVPENTAREAVDTPKGVKLLTHDAFRIDF